MEKKIANLIILYSAILLLILLFFIVDVEGALEGAHNCNIVFEPDQIIMNTGSTREVLITNTNAEKIDVYLSFEPMVGLQSKTGILEQENVITGLEYTSVGSINVSSRKGIDENQHYEAVFHVGQCEHEQRLPIIIKPEEYDISGWFSPVVFYDVPVPFSDFSVDIKWWHVVLGVLLFLFFLWRFT